MCVSHLPFLMDISSNNKLITCTYEFLILQIHFNNLNKLIEKKLTFIVHCVFESAMCEA